MQSRFFRKFHRQTCSFLRNAVCLFTNISSVFYSIVSTLTVDLIMIGDRIGGGPALFNIIGARSVGLSSVRSITGATFLFSVTACLTRPRSEAGP